MDHLPTGKRGCFQEGRPVQIRQHVLVHSFAFHAVTFLWSAPLRVLLLCAFILGGAATLQPADALAWQADGVPVCTNPGDQAYPLMIADGAGGVFLAWIDGRNGFDDVYAQHVTGSGAIAPGWPDDGLAVCTAPDLQGVTDLVTDSAGGLFLVWDDYRNQGAGVDVYAHHVLANGIVDPNWPVNGLAIAAYPGEQRDDDLAPDGQGGVFIVWDDFRNGAASRDVYMQHVNANGTLAAGWPAGGRTICTVPAVRAAPRILADGSGGAFVAWNDRRNTAQTSLDLYALRVTSAGDPASGWTAAGVAVCTAAGGQAVRGIITDGSGGFYLDWQDWRTAPPNDPAGPQYGHVYMQHMTGDGAIVTGWPADGLGVCTATGGQQSLSLEVDGAGGALVAWFDHRDANPGVYLARLLTTGALAPGWPANGLQVSTAGGFQELPDVAADGTGGAYVSFVDLNTYQARAQHITGGGTLAPGWPPTGVRLAFTLGQQSNPSIASDGLGSAIVAWDDTRNGFNRDIFAQQLVPNGPTATLVSLMSADAQTDHVRLTWLASDPSQLVATVQRRTETTDWVPLGTIYPDGSGQLIYEDRDVIPRSRYGYRLSYPDGGAVTMTSETWVNIPGLVFALAGFTPNPTFGEPVVTFSLPVAGPATLELYDVQGRTVLRREVGSFGVGRHRMKLDARGALPAGVYALRLRQGERQALVRAVVMR
jgi:hypothetical protein